MVIIIDDIKTSTAEDEIMVANIYDFLLIDSTKKYRDMDDNLLKFKRNSIK
ncbi:MAG: hypothetical protein IJ593_00530 [Lachnospiraceae bacterium]|nr:hypothetical protein [Lachnospiraceae bacterium]